MVKPRQSVIWSPEAERDLIEIWGYWASEASAEVADNQICDISAACTRSEEWPCSGRARGELLPGARSVPVRPNVVFYRVRDEAVEIVRVIDGRRDIDAIFSEQREDEI
jgi:toxin ParE1/3/4